MQQCCYEIGTEHQFHFKFSPYNFFQIAKEYLKVQTELAYITQKRQELQEEASRCASLLPKIEEQDNEEKKLRAERVSILKKSRPC